MKDGEILGLLGPNGAGKSTTMNIITGNLAATDGTAAIDGHEILEEPLRAKKSSDTCRRYHAALCGHDGKGVSELYLSFEKM